MSYLNDLFENQLIRSGTNWKWEREYRFAPPRRFRFDFAWPSRKVAVEIQGGTFIKGAHSRGAGIRKDYQKNNLSALHGWTVIYGDERMVKNGELLKWVEKVMEGK